MTVIINLTPHKYKWTGQKEEDFREKNITKFSI